MTKKSKKTNKSVIKEVKSDIEELTSKINQSEEFIVISQRDGYLVVCVVADLKIRIEKSGNIFQPFGKNIDKYFPICFPVITDVKKAKSDNIIELFNLFSMPLLHLNKEQIKLDTRNIEKILDKYIENNFSS